MCNAVRLRNNRAGDDDPARDDAALHLRHGYAGRFDGVGAQLRHALLLGASARIALRGRGGPLRLSGRHRRLLKYRYGPSQQKTAREADGQYAQTTDHDVSTPCEPYALTTRFLREIARFGQKRLQWRVRQ